MQDLKIYSFDAILESVKFNQITTAIFLPNHIIIELPKGRIRVSGTINGTPFSLAVQFRKDGKRYIAIGAPLRKAAGIEAGDGAIISFRILNLNAVDSHQTFETVVQQVEEVRKISKITSKDSKLVESFVSTARNLDSRVRKSIEMVQRSKCMNQSPLPNSKKNKNK